ncbi:MFS transporter [Nocardia sp. alder85J]|uniref:MFS transporter n=1 Tax=Nocardia sp. alder85J TaxID=2862949 RepID=UPI001CD2AC57|nr:MFS transporter [Nocardia sp. alder85J]MCX4092486.1 MFS transporter [Nocardia sp. alder85J]
MTAESTSRWPAWLTPNLRVLCAVSFLADTASELVYPVLPIFLTTVLGAPTAVVGGVEGAAEATAALTKILVGRLGDRRRKRPLIAVGYALAALGKIIVAAAVAWPLVLAGRCVDRLGKGVRNAPRDALLMVGADPTRRGRIFGVHRAADTAGAVVGPALGLGLYELLGHQIRPLLMIAVLPAFAAVALVAAVRENPATATTFTAESAAADTPARLPARLRTVIAVLTVFSLVNFPDSLLLLRAHQLGLSVAGVIAGYIAYNAAYALLSYPAGALSDSLPRHFVFAGGLVCFAVGYLGLGLANSPTWVFVVLPVYGGFAAATDGVGKAWIADLAPAARQSTAQGIYQGLTGAAVLVAGLWAGLFWQTDGRMPLLISGGVALALAAVLALTGSRLSPAGAARGDIAPAGR